MNGLISIAFSWRYRQPLVFFWPIPGTVLVGPALEHVSFPEVVGAFLATGVVMLVLGLSGWVRSAMAAVPMPIVMGMVAGVFLRFGLDRIAIAPAVGEIGFLEVADRFDEAVSVQLVVNHVVEIKQILYGDFAILLRGR